MDAADCSQPHCLPAPKRGDTTIVLAIESQIQPEKICNIVSTLLYSSSNTSSWLFILFMSFCFKDLQSSGLQMPPVRANFTISIVLYSQWQAIITALFGVQLDR